MCVLPVRPVEEIILHIQGNSVDMLRDISFGNGLAGQNKHKAEKRYEK